MSSLYCDRCGYPLVYDWSDDKGECLVCSGKVKRKLVERVDWKSKTDLELIQTWRTVLEFAPSLLWEVEAEILSRPSFRQLYETERADPLLPHQPVSLKMLRALLRMNNIAALANGGGGVTFRNQHADSAT